MRADIPKQMKNYIGNLWNNLLQNLDEGDESRMACSDIKKKKLTPKMKYFAELYVTTGNATRSYIEAYNKEVGDVNSASYKLCKNEAYLLLKNEAIREYVAELTSQRSPLANENWLVDKLLGIINDPNAKDADKIRAMDTILKCLGSYTTNTNINAKVEADVNVNPFANLTEEELKKLAEIEDDEDEQETTN